MVNKAWASLSELALSMDFISVQQNKFILLFILCINGTEFLIMKKIVYFTYFLSLRVPLVSLGSLQLVFFFSNILIVTDIGRVRNTCIIKCNVCE